MTSSLNVAPHMALVVVTVIAYHPLRSAARENPAVPEQSSSISGTAAVVMVAGTEAAAAVAVAMTAVARAVARWQHGWPCTPGTKHSAATPPVESPTSPHAVMEASAGGATVERAAASAAATRSRRHGNQRTPRRCETREGGDNLPFSFHVSEWVSG